MYINWEKRLIYLASPRTASVATSDALLQTGFVRFKGHHGGMERAGSLDRTSFTTFTTVRNHWDTVISWMFWNHHGPSFSIRSIEKALAEAESWITYHRLFSLHLDHADIVWRYETLRQDMDTTLAKYNLVAPPLARKNVSGGRSSQDYHDYYTPETQEYVHTRFKDEIERLGYTF